MEPAEKHKEKIQEVPAPSPGFRFYPTEEELVAFYLDNKLENKMLSQLNTVIPVVNIYALEPWQLPKLAGELCSMDTEQWFFFVPRQEREARGGRPSRTTNSGYWKATGSPSHVYSSDSRAIGIKKSLVFYKGKAPTGRKTKWKLNEYRAIKPETPSATSTHAVPKLRHEVSLCRVYVVSGSFRAFDRRPPVGKETGSRDRMKTNADSSHHHGTGTNCCQNRTIMMDRRSSVEFSAGLPEDDEALIVSHSEGGDGSNSWEWDAFSTDHPATI